MVLIAGQCLKEGDPYFKVREIIPMKFQSSIMFYSQITLNNYHYDIDLIYSRTTSYFQFFIGYILVPHVILGLD